MKKHDEGYVLVLVMVVIVVLCLIASGILSGALSNINAQHAQIADMQDRYTAAGKVEMLVSLLTEETTWTGVEGTASEKLTDKVKELCGNPDETGIQVYTGEDGDPENPFLSIDKTYTVTVIAQAGEAQINAQLKFSLTLSGTVITSVGEVEYLRYETKTIEGGAPDAA